MFYSMYAVGLHTTLHRAYQSVHTYELRVYCVNLRAELYG